MSKFLQRKNLGKTFVAFLATSFLGCATLAQADPQGFGGHHGAEMGKPFHGSGPHGKYRHGVHGLKPHNAAVHFLGMADALHLDKEQISRLEALRDDYIEKNSTAKAQLKAAHSDLRRLLFADDIDTDAVEEKLGLIGRLESQLWHAFVAQLKEIKSMLSAEQKKTMHALHKSRHHRSMPMD